MPKIAIVTDSNSGITQERGKGIGNHCNAYAIFCQWQAPL